MMSIFGRRETSTSPSRKHNHFVPDGYIPPKSRPDSRQDAPVDRKTSLRSILKKSDSPRNVHSNHEHPLSQMTPPPPSPAPYPQPLPSHRKPNSPRGVMKPNPPRGTIKSPPRTPPISRPRTPPLQYSNTPRGTIKSPPRTPPMSRPRTPPGQHHSYSTTPRGILKSNSPRGILKQSASWPKSPPVSRPRTPPAQQYCDMGGDDDYTPPPSRQKSSNLGPSTKRSPPSEGSQSSYGPISVLDKYDTRESHVWQPHYPPGRVPPAKFSRARPRVRNPNIIFNRIVDAQDDGGASCSSRSNYCEDEEVEEEDEYCRKLYAPCAPPLDWDRDPLLRSVQCEERQAYRQCKLEDYLHEICARQKQSEPPEGFESYLLRCYAYANMELNAHNSKHILGYVDHRLSPLDVWVLRLCRGEVGQDGDCVSEPRQ